MEDITKIVPTLNEALLGIISTATDATEFIKGEIPDVVEQLLLWKAWENVLSILIGLCLLFILNKAVRIAAAEFKKPDSKQNDGIIIPAIMASIACMIISPMLVIASAFELLQILVSPKIYLIEYASNLIG